MTHRRRLRSGISPLPNAVVRVPGRRLAGRPAHAAGAESLAVAVSEALQERERQQERLAAIGQVAAGVAHDFNNIVAAISLAAESLESQPGLDRTGREQVGLIRREADRAAAMVWQILDFAHRGPIDRTALDLDFFFVELLPSLRLTQPPLLPIGFRADGADHRVLGNAGRLEQVVANLVANANDAITGEGRIDIGLFREEVVSPHQAPVPAMVPGGWIRIAVSDTGVGIPPEVLPRIFEPFFSTKPSGHGTGLGLAQVHGLVSQHDGHVHVATTGGAGTTVTVWIPALAAARRS